MDGRAPYVIIGGGLAGGNAAVTLREEGFAGPIIVLGNEEDVPFGRPPLSKGYLRGEESLDAWLVRPASWFGAAEVDLRGASPVAELDVRGKQVVLASGGVLEYDRILLATGGRNRKLDVPGADGDGIHYLRTRAQCDAIKDAARPGAHAVVVGMGFVGAEVAASLRQMGLEVTTVFPGSEPLARQFGPVVGGAFAELHRKFGNQLLSNERVLELQGRAGDLRVVTTTRVLACDFAVVGAGIEPNVELAAAAGLRIDDGIVVDARCQTSAPDVFAAGDVANQLHPLLGTMRLEHFNNAERQGRAAARSMLGVRGDYTEIPSFWSDQFDEKLEYVGFARSWDQVVLRGSVEDRRFLAFYSRGTRLLAVLGFNRGGDPEAEPEGELALCRQLIATQRQLTPAVLADDTIPVRELLRQG